MKKKVLLKDIAQQVGVSTALVSYVLSGKEKQARVGQEIADVIRETAKKLNYQPNHIAKSLKTGKSYTIGLIVADISNPFFANIARYIEDEAKKYNYTAIFGSSDENHEKSLDLLKVLINRQVDGFIIAPTEHSEEQIHYLQSLNLPFVLIDRYFPDIDTNHVSTNNYGAAYDATQHLLDNGYRHLAMVSYENNLVHMRDRERGYMDALDANGIKPSQPTVVKVGFNTVKRDLKIGLDKFLAAEQRVEAILFATNTLALEGLKYLNQLHYKIPTDVAVVCFDESESFDFFYSPITFIKQPLPEIAKKAVSILLDQIGNNDLVNQQIVYDAQLIVRKSCGS